MRKKFLSALLAVLIVMSLSSISALAAESNTDVAYAVEGGNIYFEKTTGIITDCDNTVTKAVIPAKIEGVAVTDIGNNAFNNCEKHSSLTLTEPTSFKTLTTSLCFFVIDTSSEPSHRRTIRMLLSPMVR